MMQIREVASEVKCYHCDDLCRDEPILFDNKNFCCTGCKTIYELFQDDELKDLYEVRNKSNPHLDGKFDFLKSEKIANDLHSFLSDNHNVISLSLPDIHCSACVYILENLNDFNSGVIQTKVNFARRSAQVHYNPQQITLTDLAALLSSIGYPPAFHADTKEKPTKKRNHRLSIQIGVAAFCFGNIMLLSFPEYLGIKEGMSHSFDRFFNYLNLALVLPSVFYAGRGYFISAYKGFTQGFINIDVPIALGMLILFVRSSYEIISATGAGYMDSLAGLIFFLLIGKWFQSRTYENLSFDRDYKSYFPLAVLQIIDNEEVATPIQQLKKGDHILIRNQEIVPADAILLSDEANIDYSFVTGEERTTRVKKGAQIFAGGRQVGAKIQLSITKATSQSYLTSLWNNDTFKQEKTSLSLEDKISKYFTGIILLITIVAAVYWYFYNPTMIWLVTTSVLIVACPCALALSAPFTHGNTLRILGRNKFYLKSADVAERLTEVNTIVFDKTGTITTADNGEANQWIDNISEFDQRILKSMTANSTHPLSQKIHLLLGKVIEVELQNFQELVGKGIEADYQGKRYSLGSALWTLGHQAEEGQAFFTVDGHLISSFQMHNSYRSGLQSMMQGLSSQYDLQLLSGDNAAEEGTLKKMIPELSQMIFGQKPNDKLAHVKSIQQSDSKVLMLGDGLNDAGALSQSDVGIAVAEDVSSFSPACDAIIEGSIFTKLGDFLRYLRGARHIIIASFVISFLYNIVGLSFAVTGHLTPVFAAVLMPLSSITVVVFTTLAGNLWAEKLNL
ncbi:heavy metal translocating P-type ATPase [Fulvivirga ligni]|uniref:heavy metal translocating P-type ATPase n=1 Tax=Fulvivirga ligni TaxID=2904246 RepID=UPI001F2D696A|nr:heavy metal translocating P-type ATPase metal-binding domain-containing protein [Fulvivirga ligni]UII19085.1 heavy metal translocating P-type ATPase metal-binding domain-containing protein [Fulvivirga ligni]